MEMKIIRENPVNGKFYVEEIEEGRAESLDLGEFETAKDAERAFPGRWLTPEDTDEDFSGDIVFFMGGRK